MRCAALLVAFLVVACTLSGVAGATAPPPEIGGPSTEFHVHLEPDGDARWEVEMTYQLDSENETAAFQRFADRFKAGEVNATPDIAFFRAAAAGASTVADREMSITDVSRSASLGGETGTLELRFVWTSFLDGGGEEFVLRDALRTADNGTWLGSLERHQTLYIHTPKGYDIDRSPEARQENDSLVIDGPESFTDADLYVVYERAEQTSPGSDTPLGSDPDLGVVAAGVVLLVVTAVAAVWLWQRRSGGSAPATTDRPDDPDGGAAMTAEVGEGAPEPADESASNGASAASNGVNLDLLSDEERVEHLLEQNGGRMRQADIVTETDWSDAKVSQLLSRMADEDRVEKLRLGRENLISLPDAEEPGDDGE